MYKIRTVDVWDTLLRRDCHPECIKLTTASHLLLGWLEHLKPDFRDVWSLYQARIDAEKFLAESAKSHGGDDEYEITEVLRHWVDSVFSRPHTNALPVELAEFELSTEIARSFVDPDIEEFLRLHQAEKTIFLSDFYMDSTMLKRLLCAKGVDAITADGVVSCDVGLNKRSGKLFQHIHALHGVLPSEHVHLGDNQWSDVDSPRGLGVDAHHYIPENAHKERLERERLFSSRTVLFEHLHGECRALSEATSQNLFDKQAAAFRLGVDAAPLFIGFAIWIAEQAIAQKLDGLFFFTREGEFFHRVFLEVFPHGKLFGHELPPSRVLEVSRLATFAPSMKNISVEEMSRVWSLFKSQSVSGLFATLGLKCDDFLEILENCGLKACDVITEPSDSEELKKLFCSQVFLEAAKQSVGNQKEMLLAYLKQSGLGAGERVGVVDVGWRGTIQDNIALVLPETSFHGLYLGLRRVINQQPANVSKSAYGPDENISNVVASVFQSFAVMELLCNSANGSVVGYKNEADQASALRQIDEEENDFFSEFAKHFQEGVILAAKNWQPYLERYAVSASDLQGTALHIWNTLYRAPGDDLAQAFMQAPQHDVFCYGAFFKRNRFPSLSTIFFSPLIKSRRRQLIDYIRRVQWTQAIENSRDIGWFHRSVLLLVFRMANFVRRVRSRPGFFKIGRND